VALSRGSIRSRGTRLRGVLRRRSHSQARLGGCHALRLRRHTRAGSTGRWLVVSSDIPRTLGHGSVLLPRHVTRSIGRVASSVASRPARDVLTGYGASGAQSSVPGGRSSPAETGSLSVGIRRGTPSKTRSLTRARCRLRHGHDGAATPAKATVGVGLVASAASSTPTTTYSLQPHSGPSPKCQPIRTRSAIRDPHVVGRVARTGPITQFEASAVGSLDARVPRGAPCPRVWRLRGMLIAASCPWRTRYL
jgi:hypothetical protein